MVLTNSDDAANATRRLKGDLPGQDKEAKKAGEEGYEAVRATAQQYVRDDSDLKRVPATDIDKADRAKNEAQKAEEKFDQYSVEARKKYEEAKRQAELQLKEGRKEANAAINEFDKKVTEGASQSKSWLGSWFGGK